MNTQLFKLSSFFHSKCLARIQMRRGACSEKRETKNLYDSFLTLREFSYIVDCWLVTGLSDYITFVFISY